MSKKETQNTIKPHTEAKLEFYIKYLERYLAILLHTKAVKKINIYDIYCGLGIYEDGKEGSAIRAFKAIKESIKTLGDNHAEVNLTLNDLDKDRITLVENLISNDTERSIPRFNIYFSQRDASDLLRILTDRFKNQPESTKNLVFIDPYGYKHIDKELISSLLNNGRTETIIFLPITHMYRFTGKVKEESTESFYLPLKKFITQFDINIDLVDSDLSLINEIASSLKFNDTYKTTSYRIKNQQGTYYALFFVTNHVYGLEKVLEVKWRLDKEQGEGFTNRIQGDLFLEKEKLGTLKELIISFIKSPRSNQELYEFTLSNGFLPKHANNILKNLQQENKISITPPNIRKGSFYISKDHHQENQPKITIELMP